MGQGYRRDEEPDAARDAARDAADATDAAPRTSGAEPPAAASPRDHGRVGTARLLVRTGARPPRYAHRPGVTPHPGRVPGVHLPELELLVAGGAEAAAAATAMLTGTADGDGLAAEDRAAIRLGADLHDGGWWWEAHEAWELPWRRWPRAAPEARLLQALVQDAAAFLQRERGRPGGVARLRARATANRRAALAEAPARTTWLGLDHVARDRAMDEWAASSGAGDPDAFPRLPDDFAGGR